MDKRKSNVENLLMESADRKTNIEPGFLKKNSIALSLITFFVLLAVCTYLVFDGMNVGTRALAESYSNSYATERSASYERLYQAAFDMAERRYHVSNRMVISIGDLEEVANLEVLKASNVEFITEDKDDNSGNITAWLEVTGEGTFIINLMSAEFIVDDVRRNVIVRVPQPELTNVIITDTTRRLFKDNWLLNGSYSEGVDLAIKQQNEARLQTRKALMSNQYIFTSAQDVGRSMITNLVKQFNPDIPDLKVEVEFVD